MITLAFYKGRSKGTFARLIDWSIRFRTAPRWLPFEPAIYSHVEVIAGPARLGTPVIIHGSSARDGGVRSKEVTLNPTHWDLVELPVDSSKVVGFINSCDGARYDYLGIIASQVFSGGVHDRDKWFCSEIVAAALGLDQPQRIDPQMLFEMCQKLPHDARKTT